MLVALLALLTAVAALSTDLYLPALPAVAADLGATASGVQLTLTAFMVGLAAGQFVIGPLSDVLGRRRPLLAGVGLCLAASVACALAPDLGTLALARFVQGFSGAAGVVIARAIVADTTRGRATAKLMGLMMIIVGVMPVLAPLGGAAVLQFAPWRGVFWAVAALVLVMVVGSLTVVPETLPPERRHPVGLRPLLANAAAVLRTRRYRYALLTFALSFGAMFSYISASPFVLQEVAGLTTVQYAVAFGVNGLGMMTAGLVSIRLVDRLPVLRVLSVGVGLLLLAAVGLLVTVLLGTPTVPLLACLFVLVSAMGLVLGNASATAMGAVPDRAGTGSALLGTTQFLLAALVAPLVGLGGKADPLPMAVTVLACAALAATALLALPRDAGDRTRAAVDG
ncbi:Bcr/CflA family efflux MFS transporter [Citricoccus sp. SGAir0253]|nr:Bcr/CflA family efflux MFS transporter [Citricoccus sp. SGAir0253]